MPDEITPQPTASTSPAPKSNIKLYVALGVIGLLGMVCWSIFGKYKLSESSLTTMTKSYTDTKTLLEESKKQFSDYQKKVESNTSWTEDTYFENGRLKKRIVYNKNAISSFSGATTILTNTSSNTASNTTTNSTSVAKNRTQEGVPINGVVYVGLPPSIFTGTVKSANLGFDHATGILDAWVGGELGSNDLEHIFKNHYIFLHFGWGVR